METDFSKNMLEKFAANSDGTKKLHADIQQYNEAVKDAESKGYKPEYITEIKETLIDGLIKDYEVFRQDELARIDKETSELEKIYNKDMVTSDAARKSIDILEKDYSALSDSEVEQKYKDYVNQKINDPHELETLSRSLRKRKSANFENFRKHYKQRGDDRPYEKINPDLYKYKEDLKNIQYGEALIYLTGENAKGEKVKVGQSHKIRDLI